jgi:uncharacterized protein
MASIDTARVTVCVFAKPPRPGQAKTRLAAALGEAAAARLAEAFLRDTWSTARALDWARPVLATTDEHDQLWASLGCEHVWPQGDGDLGQRMERVLRRALTMDPAAIVVGTDCPSLSASCLDLARAALSVHDAVIGPSEDGGYYLLGVRHCPAGLLAGVAWSTDHACSQTVDRLRGGGLSVGVLPTAFDVDRPEDVERLRGLGSQLGRMAPETARALEGLSIETRDERP